MSLRRWRLGALFVTVAAVSAFDYSFLISDNTKQARLDYHRNILAHTATAPENYRVLAPYTLEWPIRAAARLMPYEDAFHRVYAAFYLFALAAMYAALFAYLKLWFTPEQALVGALVVSSIIPIALRHHSYAPYSLLEPTFFAIGLTLMVQERRLPLAAVIAAASLNRETGIFLVFLYAVTMRWTRQNVTTALAYLAIWGAAFTGIRWMAGDTSRYWDLATVWYGNTHDTGNFITAAINVSLFLGFFWLFAVLGFRRAPPFTRRAAAMIPIYCATVAIWGLWWEVRLLLPLYPVVLPLALAYLFESTRGQ